MKRIPFTLEAWKAGGVPVTRGGEYVKPENVAYLPNAKYPLVYVDNLGGYTLCDIKGIFYVNGKESDNDLLLEVPCEKWYTHYYRLDDGTVFSQTSTSQDKIPRTSTYLKTV